MSPFNFSMWNTTETFNNTMSSLTDTDTRSNTFMQNVAGVLNITDTMLSFATTDNNTSAWNVWESTLGRFSLWYEGVHGYVSTVVCVFGIICNIMNIVVLTRKNMISTTNVILTALAIADMLTMAVYLPSVIYFYCITDLYTRYKISYAWIVYYIFGVNFTIALHTTAAWLTVALAVFRYIAICHYTFATKFCTVRNASITIVGVFLVTCILCTPNYIMLTPVKTESSGYWFKARESVSRTHEEVNFWFLGILKVAPCQLITIFSLLLLRAMRQAEVKQRRLKSQGKDEESQRTRDHNRSTAMLVTVIICFVIAELPQGILAILGAIDKNIFLHVYVPLGSIWDILALLNSAVDFLLYCTMSRQFRQTFKDVFRCQ